MSLLTADILVPSTNKKYDISNVLQSVEDTGVFGHLLVAQPDALVRYDVNGSVISREKHSFHSRAELRNSLIQESRSQICICVDNDILLQPGFVEGHIQAHQHFTGAMVVGPVYARKMTGKAFARFQNVLDTVDPATLKDELSTHPVFCDPRSDAGIFSDNRSPYSIRHLDTAWRYMWTCNISFPRDAALAYGGFDDGFNGWGLEDEEFAYRFFLHGADLVVADDAWGIHQYHDRDMVRNEDDWYQNLEYFFRKWTNHDIEFLRLGVTGFQGASMLIPGLLEHDEKIDEKVIDEVMASEAPSSRCMYFYPSDDGCSELLSRAGITHALLPHKFTCKQPFDKDGVTFLPLAGMSTQFPDDYFQEVIVVQNKILHFNTLILRSLFLEFSRISRVVLLYSWGPLGGEEKNLRILNEAERICGNKLHIPCRKEAV